jgi:hypothetical protein
MSKIRSIIESTILTEYTDAKHGYFIRCTESPTNEISYYNTTTQEWTNLILNCTVFSDKREARRALAKYLELCLEEIRGPGGFLGNDEDIYEDLIRNNDTFIYNIGGNFEFSIGYINID